MGFLHKDLDLKEKERIGEDVKEIVNSFGEVLDSFGDLPEEGFVIKEKSFREEKNDFFCDEDFRRRILENAPEKNKDFIIAERKKW